MPTSDQGERAYQQLLLEITEWTLAPGTTLAEVELARRLEVSRTPLRDALRRLQREGLVEQEAGQSARVASVSVERTVAIFQAREALETYALRLAAAAPDRAVFRDLARKFHAIADHTPADVEAVYSLSRDFDEAVSRTAGNAYITALLKELYVQLARLRRLSRDDTERLQAAARQHAVIAEAVSRGDAATAARTEAERLRSGLDTILRVLRSGLLGPDGLEATPCVGQEPSPPSAEARTRSR